MAYRLIRPDKEFLPFSLIIQNAEYECWRIPTRPSLRHSTRQLQTRKVNLSSAWMRIAYQISRYIEYCIDALQAGKAENVGGVWRVKPGADTWVARSIAQAGSHPLGVGDARYRFATKADYVETVPFGAYKKQLIERIGGYDETLHANEDYEFNTRILKSGGKIWMDPAIQVDYFSRSTFSALTRQYWNYGFWKAVMLKHYPSTVRLRQAMPPLFVLGLIGLLLLSFVHPAFLWIFGISLLIYTAILMLTSIGIAYQKHYLAFIIGVPIAVCIMHICWGSGFLWSGLKLAMKHRGVTQKSE